MKLFCAVIRLEIKAALTWLSKNRRLAGFFSRKLLKNNSAAPVAIMIAENFYRIAG